MQFPVFTENIDQYNLNVLIKGASEGSFSLVYSDMQTRIRK